MQENRKEFDNTEHTLVIEGRNAVLEAFRSGKPIDKVFVLDGCQDGPVRTIVREAKKHDTIINFVGKERLSQISVTGKHQGVIAYAAAYEYSEVEDMLKLAEERGEDPFLILLRRSSQSGCDHSNCKSGRGTRRDHSEEKSSGTDCDRGKNFCRSLKLYSGRKSHKPGKDNGRIERKRALVRVCGYGRRIHVSFEPERTDWSGDRK